MFAGLNLLVLSHSLTTYHLPPAYSQPLHVVCTHQARCRWSACYIIPSPSLPPPTIHPPTHVCPVVCMPCFLSGTVPLERVLDIISSPRSRLLRLDLAHLSIDPYENDR